MCVYIAITSTILPVTLWRMSSAAALKCNAMESWLAGHLDTGNIHQRGAWYMNVQGVYSVGECKLEKQIFLIDH